MASFEMQASGRNSQKVEILFICYTVHVIGSAYQYSFRFSPLSLNWLNNILVKSGKDINLNA